MLPPLRAVWVERQNVNPEKAGLTQAQILVCSIFMTKEIDCRIEKGGTRSLGKEERLGNVNSNFDMLRITPTNQRNVCEGSIEHYQLY